ncbi:MAG: hypothetical protein K8F91_18080 [Candidatus Obscuribacterales bacterium]|nr:hypothetical protein [Candidatus Obscuribacterales bacterium]
MLDYLLVGKADSGEISVFDDRDNFIAGFVEGKWVLDHVFSDYFREEHLNLVQDDEEALRILKEARTALDCPLTKNESNQAKSA